MALIEPVSSSGGDCSSAREAIKLALVLAVRGVIERQVVEQPVFHPNPGNQDAVTPRQLGNPVENGRRGHNYIRAVLPQAQPLYPLPDGHARQATENLP